ncbi:MAG: tetraacyldisaccharide 4'-kinase [Bacteroidales bacterium]|nr:tetraacyldisaccharide 4'-kinase [Bacteroidales bacterium]
MLKWLLFPFSLLYGFIVSFRNILFDYNFLNSHEFDVPVLSVGNITVGGTGKTPHVEYIVDLLNKEFNVATLSRGYKRKSKGFVLASENSTVKDIGDEPKQIKKKFPDIHVAVDNNRVHGIKKLLSKKIETIIDVIILDDAFQHRYVKPGFSILLIDFNQPLSNDHLLPLGRLREHAHEKRRANLILITKSPNELKPIERRIIVKDLKLFPYQTLYFTTYKYGNLIPVFNNDNVIDNEKLKNKSYSVLVITGIAKYKPFVQYIKTFSNDIHHIGFPDHHYFTKKDINKILNKFNDISNPNKIIITTEKDSVRFYETSYKNLIEESPIFYIPIEIDFLNEDKENFNKLITNYIRSNKRKIKNIF